MLAHARSCSLMLAHARSCSLMLAHARSCSLMLAHAHDDDGVACGACDNADADGADDAC